jgi:hypothetical protein
MLNIVLGSLMVWVASMSPHTWWDPLMAAYGVWLLVTGLWKVIER